MSLSSSSSWGAWEEQRRRARIRAEIAEKVREIDAERARLREPELEPYCELCGLRFSHWQGCPGAKP